MENQLKTIRKQKFAEIFSSKWYYCYVRLTNTWKTTDRVEGPTGRKESGTFRDISLVHALPEYIDNVDHVCQELGISRSALVERMQNARNANPLDFLLSDNPQPTPLRGWRAFDREALRSIGYIQDKPDDPDEVRRLEELILDERDRIRKMPFLKRQAIKEGGLWERQELDELDAERQEKESLDARQAEYGLDEPD